MSDSVTKFLDDNKAFEGFSRARVSTILTNPNLDDNPIVDVNDAFQRVTGYAGSATIGRNGRFLQAKDTDPRDVARPRTAIAREEDITVDIPNYRANGEPFLNRLTVAPVKDQNGRRRYFIGVQKKIGEQDLDSAADKVSRELMEVQNRVRADRSMVIAMIRQQSRETAAPEDFVAWSRRIETMQTLHEEMKPADSKSNRDEIALGSDLSRVARAIAHIDGRSGIRMTLRIEPLAVSIETATRAGLALSEVLTNAFQHAFERLVPALSKCACRASRKAGCA